MELKAKPGGCEEASPKSGEYYIPCNRPAVRMIQHSDGDYRMCEMCAYHNVKNRGAKDIGPYVSETPLNGHQFVSETPPPAEQVDYSAYAADAAESIEPGNILSQITHTVRELRQLREDIVQAEEVLKAFQKRERTLVDYTLPEMMREAGQERLRTSDGYDVELTETLRASIPAPNLSAAIAWLVDHKQSAIIKHDLRLQFGKDEDEKADRALALILEAGFVPSDKLSVHPQTLAATIKELMAAGVDVPLELLGAHVQAGVKVKEAKR